MIIFHRRHTDVLFTAEAQSAQSNYFFALALRRRQSKTTQPCGHNAFIYFKRNIFLSFIHFLKLS